MTADDRGLGHDPSGRAQAPTRATSDRRTDAERIDAMLPELRRRSPGAFHELHDLMAPQLLAFLHGCTGQRADAEDITQDVFVQLTRSIRRFRGDGRALLAWLYRTARRRCADVHRRRGRRRERLVDVVPERPDPTPGGSVSGLATLDPELDAALSTLTPDQRAALLLRRVAGLDGQTVGEVLGRDREAVYALVARAEAALRARLGGTPLDPTADRRPEG